MKALIAILVAVLQVLLPALFKAAEKTAEDSTSQPELRNRLRKRVRQTWAVAFLCIFFLAGCGARTIYVGDGEPVRLRETIHNAKVWVMDASGKLVASRMDLPEGWYCLPVPANEDDKGK